MFFEIKGLIVLNHVELEVIKYFGLTDAANT